MKLKPLRFIGHKIGPFDHIELNWEKDSRHTLIVAENGMGKTTLVAAMAACLSFGDDSLFPDSHFQRFTHDEESFAFFEVVFGDEVGWLLRWGTQTYRGLFGVESLQLLADFYYVFRLSDLSTFKLSTVGPEITKPHGLPDLDEHGPVIFLESLTGTGIQGACTLNLIPLITKWRRGKEINGMGAAYGVGRDIQQPVIQEHQEFSKDPLEHLLNPFSPISSSEIFQWVANQYVYHALALAENKLEEAQAYLTAIQRVEQLLNEGLEYPISFHVKRNPFRLDVRQNGTTLSVDQLSDGTRSFLSWPLDYLMRASRINWENPADSAVAPGLVLVDEIDAHLHPEWQRRAMSVVSQLLPETYVIATTHSPFVLGSTDDAQVFQIYKDVDGKLKVKADFDELYGYPADLVLQKAFVPSLYPPEMERRLKRLSELTRKVAAGDISPQEKEEHDALLEELAAVNPWLNNLLALSPMGGPAA